MQRFPLLRAPDAGEPIFWPWELGELDVAPEPEPEDVDDPLIHRSSHKCTVGTACRRCGYCDSAKCARNKTNLGDVCPLLMRNASARQPPLHSMHMKWSECAAEVTGLKYTDKLQLATGRAFRAQSPEDPDEWRTIGQFAFDTVSRIIKPREGQVAQMFDPSIHGAHLFLFEDIDEATPGYYRTPIGTWVRSLDHVRYLYCNSVGYTGYRDFWYDTELFTMLVAEEHTVYQDGLTRDGKGVNTLSVCRTIARHSYPNFPILSSQYARVLEHTLNMFQNFLVVRSLMASASTPAGVTKAAVKSFRFLAASQMESSGAACGDKQQPKQK